jgi:hypothetical protein
MSRSRHFAPGRKRLRAKTTGQAAQGHCHTSLEDSEMTEAHLAQRAAARLATLRQQTAAVSLAVLCALPMGAQAAGSVKAANVETAIPSRPYYGALTLTDVAKATGPGKTAAVLGISSITIHNQDVSPQQVNIFTPLFINPGCSQPIMDHADPVISVTVPAKSTLHLPFPSPLVFNPVNGVTCVAALALSAHTAPLTVYFVGTLN